MTMKEGTKAGLCCFSAQKRYKSLCSLEERNWKIQADQLNLKIVFPFSLVSRINLRILC